MNVPTIFPTRVIDPIGAIIQEGREKKYSPFDTALRIFNALRNRGWSESPEIYVGYDARNILHDAADLDEKPSETAMRLLQMLERRGWVVAEEHESALSAIETGGILREGTTHNTKVSEVLDGR